MDQAIDTMNDPRTQQQPAMPIKWFFLLWLIAFVPRLVLTGVFFQQSIALDDMYQYDMLARSMLKGNGYRWYSARDVEPLKPYYEQFLDLERMTFPEEGIKTAHRGPGYPAFLTAVYALVPEQTRFGWTRLIQAVFTAGLAPLTTLIALYSGFRKRTSILSGIGIGLYPILLFYPLALASENLFLLTLASGFACLLVYNKTGRWTPLVLSSLCLTVSLLTRSVVLVFILFSAAWLFFRPDTKKIHAAVFLAIILLLCLPWAVRNSHLMDKPTFLETSLGYNLFISYHPEGDGSFISDIAIRPLTFIDDQTREEYTKKKAVQFIRRDPGNAIVRVFRKVAFFFGLEDRGMIYFYGNGFFGPIPQPWRWLLYVVLVLPWVLTLIFFPLGMLTHHHRLAIILSLGMLITYALPHILVIAEPRFHLALLPFLMPYAARGWIKRGTILHILSSPLSGTKQRAFLILAWVTLILLMAWNISMHWETVMQIMGPDGHNLHLTY